MSKMNRRDYLLKMGAGVGTVLTIPDLAVFASPQKRGRRRPLSRSTIPFCSNSNNALVWPVINNAPPRDAPVTVILGGLMGFFYRPNLQGSRVCAIGFHPGRGVHAKQFEIHEIRNNQCSDITQIPTNVNISVKLTNQSQGPQFYETTAPVFDRYSTEPMDFRWLPDLHSSEFYPSAPLIKPGSYTGWLYVYDGTFYTHQKTNSTFLLVDKNQGNLPICRYGHVAMYMAVAIAVPPHATVDVLADDPVNPLVKRLTPDTNLRYEIDFTNECSLDCPDSTTIHNSNEENRNDFHFNRRVLNLPPGATEYALMIESDVPETPVEFCGRESRHPRSSQGKVHKISDSAPCMGAGYGGR